MDNPHYGNQWDYSRLLNPSSHLVLKMDNPYYLKYLEANQGGIDAYLQRRSLVQTYAWAVPDVEVIKLLASKHPRIVEMGAGTGYWIHLLSLCGIQVEAFDRFPPHRGSNPYKHNREWYPVKKARLGILKRFQGWTLLLCWPPYSDAMATASLRHFGGNKLIYIGENHGGCTGDDTFHNTLYKEWNLIDSHDIPQWDGIHDRVYEYQRC